MHTLHPILGTFCRCPARLKLRFFKLFKAKRGLFRRNPRSMHKPRTWTMSTSSSTDCFLSSNAAHAQKAEGLTGSDVQLLDPVWTTLSCKRSRRRPLRLMVAVGTSLLSTMMAIRSSSCSVDELNNTVHAITFLPATHPDPHRSLARNTNNKRRQKLRRV